MLVLGRRAARFALLTCALAAVAAVVALSPGSARAGLIRSNNTPFPTSKAILFAQFTTKRYNPPANQTGDILPTVWADDGQQYVLINDGGTNLPKSGGFWRNSFAKVTGSPPNIGFSFIGNPLSPPPATWSQISRNPSLHSGPLGPYYSDGFVSIGNTFFATQTASWDYNHNRPFQGLAGIAYSTNEGATWNSPGNAFPAPLGNLSWVLRDEGEQHPDGYVYAINSEREFNASTLIIGRSLPDVADMTNPASWQWLTGWQPSGGEMYPVWSSSVQNAVPIASWASHITYPQMSYDAPIHRYLLTFTHSYSNSVPGIWRSGAELDLLEAPHPWGPFSFVAREINFGPSNGYASGFPEKWISRNGHTLWLKWAANFDGCNSGLDCTGAYGFNYARVQLTMAPQAK
ncbi:MAG TPA: hypothetical protein VG186_08500 [Solirubrobacteraceae bacterium]|nr:hypothetical protein [Solirubrobacteraceae bacterium]